MASENKNYKDTVFSDLFYQDQSAKQNLLSLYNALFDENLTDPQEISLIRLENTLFMSLNNDVAFTVGNRKIILAEHQSTINENMPLRSLLYLAREYEQYFSTDVRYRRNAVKIPTPIIYTFYNGAEDYPLEKELKLSASFLDATENPALDLTVKVININYGSGHSLLEKCTILNQYSEFISIVRNFKNQENPLELAIKQCISKGILADYLSRKGSEVVNMLIAEYDYETDIRVQREEAKEEGRSEGHAEGRAEGHAEGRAEGKEESKREIARKVHTMGFSDEMIRDMTGLSLSELKQLWEDE